MRGGGGSAEHEHRVGGGAGGPGQDNLTVLLNDTVGERAALRLAAPHADPESATAPGALGLAERVVHRVGDGAPSAGQVAQQLVPVEQPQRPGDLILLLKDKAVQAAAGDLMQHVPGVENLLIGGPYLRAGRRRDPRRGDGLDGVHIALAAA